MKYIDCFFMGYGAVTQAGLNTVNVNQITLYQQLVIYFCCTLTTPIFIHSILVFVRLYWFERTFDNIKTSSKLNYKMRRDATIAGRTATAESSSHAGIGLGAGRVTKASTYSRFLPKVKKFGTSSHGNNKNNGYLNAISETTAYNTASSSSPLQKQQYYDDDNKKEENTSLSSNSKDSDSIHNDKTLTPDNRENIPLQDFDNPNKHQQQAKSHNNNNDNNGDNSHNNNNNNNIKFANLPQPRRRESINPRDMYMSIAMMRQKNNNHFTEEGNNQDEEGPVLIVKGPAERERVRKKQKKKRFHNRLHGRTNSFQLNMNGPRQLAERARLQWKSRNNSDQIDEVLSNRETNRPVGQQKQGKLQQRQHDNNESALTDDENDDEESVQVNNRRNAVAEEEFLGNEDEDVDDDEDDDDDDDEEDDEDDEEDDGDNDEVNDGDPDDEESLDSQAVDEDDDEDEENDGHDNESQITEVDENGQSRNSRNKQRTPSDASDIQKVQSNFVPPSADQTGGMKYKKRAVTLDTELPNRKPLIEVLDESPSRPTAAGLKTTFQENKPNRGTKNNRNSRAARSKLKKTKSGKIARNLKKKVGKYPSIMLDDLSAVESRSSNKIKRQMSAAYLSFNPTFGRNSTFVPLDHHQKEELGGVEYRSLKLLAKILVGYYVGFHIISFMALSLWIIPRTHYKSILKEDGVNRTWWGAFTAASFFNDLGLTLTPDSFSSFVTSRYVLLWGSFLITIGNVAFPIMLRFIIWVMFKLSRDLSLLKESLGFLLDHPRRCFTLLFPSIPTWWLFFMLVLLNLIDLILFCILDIRDKSLDELSNSTKVLAAFFQAISTRTAGFTCIDLSSLHPAIQVSYMLMMYVSALPVAISIRRTNVYEEQSLGIYTTNADEMASYTESGSKTDQAKNATKRFIGTHLRKQLSFDLWYIFLGLFIICIAESKKLRSLDDPYFTIFQVLFEVVSAYGCVGLSLGYPNDTRSFSGQFNVVSKLVIVAMFIRGRHRGLPYAIDRAIILPSKMMDRRDGFQAHHARRNSAVSYHPNAVDDAASRLDLSHQGGINLNHVATVNVANEYENDANNYNNFYNSSNNNFASNNNTNNNTKYIGNSLYQNTTAATGGKAASTGSLLSPNLEEWNRYHKQHQSQNQNHVQNRKDSIGQVISSAYTDDHAPVIFNPKVNTALDHNMDNHHTTYNNSNSSIDNITNKKRASTLSESGAGDTGTNNGDGSVLAPDSQDPRDSSVIIHNTETPQSPTKRNTITFDADTSFRTNLDNYQQFGN